MYRSTSLHRSTLHLIAVATLIVWGCSSGEVPPSVVDGPPPREAGSPDTGASDGGTDLDRLDSRPDSLQPDGDATVDATVGDATVDSTHDAGCTLGTADDCSACGDECPGPIDGVSTQRVCVGGACDIQCEAEHYDVDGDPANGCEALDDLPVHDSLSIAADMGTHSDCASAQKESAVIPSDDRKHLKAPTERPNGRTDYFAFGIDDDWGCSVNGSATVSMTGLPAAAQYKIEAAYRCGDGSLLGPESKTISGGQSATLSPPTDCTAYGMGDDSGSVIVSVEKLSGPHSAVGYEIKIEP